MTTFPTETVRAYPGRSDHPGSRTEQLTPLNGFNAAVVRTGTALEHWGRRRARRSVGSDGQVHRNRLQSAHAEQRATASAVAHSMLLP